MNTNSQPPTGTAPPGKTGLAVLTLVFTLAFQPLLQAAEPIRALLITGGGWHDYEGQKKILTEGISARAHVVWEIDHEVGGASDRKLTRLQQPGWAEGFDVVVYNMCFAQVSEDAYVENIARVHHEGVPAVVIHCAMHAFRDAKTDAWRQLLGVSTYNHERHRPFEVKNIEPEHPIMKPFPAAWKTPQGELYMIDKVWPDTTPLAQAFGQDTRRDHVCIWINTYGKARVFGTTIGHHNETMSHDVYLDMAARGLLWTVDKLGDDGKPKAGYEAQAAPVRR